MSETILIYEPSMQTIEVDKSSTSINVTETPPESIIINSDLINIISVAVQGPPGPSGTGDLSFSYSFIVASTVQITHNLGKYPSVTVINSAGDEVEGSVSHASANNLTIYFSAPFSGTAKLN